MFKKLKLPKIVISATFIFLIILISLNIITEPSSQSLNLLIISIDTLRSDHMGIYGYSKNTTPNIDKWFQEAIVFTNATTVVPMTQPSFAELMTGKNPLNSRIITNFGLPVSKNAKTLATILEEDGYTTANFSATKIASEISGLEQGFQTVDDFSYKSFYYDKDGHERYRQSDENQYESFVTRATKWLGENKNRKFFLWIHLMDPHPPYQPSEEFQCKFDGKYCDIISKNTPEELESFRARYQMCQNELVPKEVTELMETLYDGSIASSDRLTGKILDKVKETGLDDNTIVVLYGDHGEGFDHNYYFSHRAVLYDSAIKIPLIIKYPLAKTKNKKSDRLVQNTDVLSTVLDLLKISRMGIKTDGISFSDEFSNRFLTKSIPIDKREYSYSINSSWSKFSIYDGEYKYIYSLPESCLFKGQTEELYNTNNDPQETESLIRIEEEVTERLKAKLFEQLSSYNLPIAQYNKFVPRLSPSEDELTSKEKANQTLDEFKSLGY